MSTTKTKHDKEPPSAGVKKTVTKKKAEVATGKAPRSRTKKQGATIEAVIPALQVTTEVTPAAATDVHDTNVVDKLEELVKPKWLPTVLQKIKAFTHWRLVLGVAIVLILAWVISGWALASQAKKRVKEAQQVQQKIENGKVRLAESENNLQYLQRRKVDSAINEKLKEAASLMQEHMRADERTLEENLKLKTENYAMQEKIRTASADTLIELGRQDARKSKD